jgi:lysophospholipid acyltransferase (LPLAT)-like uncharacterized protein
MEEFILFLLSFLLMLIIYELFIVRTAKKRRANKKNSKKYKDKEVTEIKYLIWKYKLDISKVNYNQLLQIVAITSSFDISVVVSIIMIINNFWLEILVGFISTLVLILISYHLVYLFYKKKGMILSE